MEEGSKERMERVKDKAKEKAKDKAKEKAKKGGRRKKFVLDSGWWKI